MQIVHTLATRVMTTYSVSFLSKRSLQGTLTRLKTAMGQRTLREKQELYLN